MTVCSRTERIRAFVTGALSLCVLAPLVLLADSSRQEAVDDMFSGYNTHTPGCAVGVYKEGSILLAKGFGMASLELGVPISPQSAFAVGSVSKQFTAATVVLASLEGHLSLDDPISKYFPELPEYAETIRIIHLIHHTSGLRDYLQLMDASRWSYEDVIEKQWLWSFIGRQTSTKFPAGEKHDYSNTGYVLLGELIVRATGKSLAAYAEDRIFAPLGMVHTRFHDNRRTVQEDRVVAYSPDGEFGYQLNWSFNLDLVGDGGLLTTVEDLSLWDRNFNDDQLGGGQLVSTMLRRGVLNSGEVLDYAFGIYRRSTGEQETVAHSGAIMGFRARFLRYLEEQLGVAVLCNVSTAEPWALARDIADLFLTATSDTTSKGAATAPPENGSPNPSAHIPRELRERYQGAYRETTTGALLPIAEQEDGLNVTLLGASLPLSGLDESSFVAAGLPQKLELQFDGSAAEVTLMIGGDEYGRYRKTETVERGPEELSAYVGLYYSRELDSDYRIRLDGETLILQMGMKDPKTLTATFDDTFEVLTEGLCLDFYRDIDHSIAGATLGTFFFNGIDLVRIGRD